MEFDGERGRNRTYNLLIKSQSVWSNHQLLWPFERACDIFQAAERFDFPAAAAFLLAFAAAREAIVALRLRSSGESFFARASPPFLPSSTAAGFFSAGCIRTR